MWLGKEKKIEQEQNNLFVGLQCHTTKKKNKKKRVKIYFKFPVPHIQTCSEFDPLSYHLFPSGASISQSLTKSFRLSLYDRHDLCDVTT